MPAKMKIRSAYATLPSAERKVADFILENSERATRMVINEIAEAAGVSVPSVTRLARKLGYSGFLDFRVALASGTANMETRKNTDILPEDSEDTVIEKACSASINALEDTYKALNKQALISLAHAVETADRIFLCGNASSALLAEDIMGQLHTLGLEAVVKGLRRIAISEHAGAHLFYGVRGTRLARLRREVDALARRYANEIEVLMGLECNLMAAGKCDAPLPGCADIPCGADLAPFDVLLLGYHKGVWPEDTATRGAFR